MASVVSSTFPARRRLILIARPLPVLRDLLFKFPIRAIRRIRAIRGLPSPP